MSACLYADALSFSESAGVREGVAFPQENLRHARISMTEFFWMPHWKLIYKVEYITSFPASSALALSIGTSTQEIKRGSAEISHKYRQYYTLIKLCCYAG